MSSSFVASDDENTGNNNINNNARRRDGIDKKAYEDALDDVHTRFLLNVPPEELATADRIFFQLEQAWWFYEDFICDNSDPETRLPRFKNFRPFAMKLFKVSPILDESQFETMWEEFSAYRRTISTFGTILLNEDCTKVVLCRVWGGSTWTFPAGKINQGEEGLVAAARETYEETGFDPQCENGMTKEMKESSTSSIIVTWKPLQEDDALSFMDDGKRRRTCYVCRGVPMGFPFCPVARKEVSEVAWHALDDLPKVKTFAVTPFMSQLKLWIKRSVGGKRSSSARKTPTRSRTRAPQQQHDQDDAAAQRKRTGTPGNQKRGSNRQQTPPSNRPKNSSRGRNSRPSSRSKHSIVMEQDPLTETGLASPGDKSRWSEEEMFLANEKLLGRKVVYDGNPHRFDEHKPQGDPHAFRVVGGQFMNTNMAELAPPPPRHQLQPLFRNEHGLGQGGPDSAAGLTPFFSSQGETPWGEVVQEVIQNESKPRMEDSCILNQQPSAETEVTAGSLQNILSQEEKGDSGQVNDAFSFPTDAQVTAKSQQSKLAESASRREEQLRQYHEDMEYIQQWVANLPRPPPTKLFGDYCLDADAILASFM